MRRWLIALSLLLLLGLGVAGGGYLFLVNQDPTWLRGQLADGLAAALGRPVEVSGEMEFRLLPLPAVSLGRISVHNEPWALADDVARVQRIHVVPSIPAMLRGRVVVHSVDLEGVTLNLENGPDGQPNWRLPAPSRTPASDAAPVRIKAIDATDVQLNYFNSRNGVTRSLALETVALRGRRRTDPLEIAFEGQVEGLPLSGNAALDSLAALAAVEPATVDLELHLGDSTLAASGTLGNDDFRDFSGLDLKVRLDGRRPALLLAWTDLPLPAVERFSLRGSLRGQHQRIELSEFDGKLGGGSFEAAVTGGVEDLATMSGVDLGIQADGGAIAEVADWLRLDWLDSKSFRIAARLAGAQRALALREVDAQVVLDAATLSATGSIEALESGDGLQLDTHLTSSDVAALGRRFDLPLPDLDAADVHGLLTGNWSAPAVAGLGGRLREGSLVASVDGSIGDLANLRDISVGFELTGTDFADLGALLGVGLPATDQVSGRGRLTGSHHDLDLRIERARLTEEDVTLDAEGRLLDLLERPRLDLGIDLQGRNLETMGDAIGADVFATDRYRVRGRLAGPLDQPDLESVNAQFVAGDILIDVAGRLPNVFEGERIDVRPLIRGNSLAELGGLLGQEWPDSETFRGRSHLTGTWAKPRVDELDAQIEFVDGSLVVRGRVGDLLGASDFELDVTARADRLTRFLPFGGYLWDALGPVSGRFRLAGNRDRMAAEVEEMTAGTSRLEGRFDLLFDDDQLARVRGTLDDSVLDITPWLQEDDDGPSSAPTQGPAPDTSQAPLFSDRELPLSWMTGLDMEVDLAGNDVMIGAGVIAVTRGTLDVDDGRLKMDPFDGRYGGADINGGFSIDARAVPRAEFHARALSFDVGDLLRSTGVSPSAQGRVDFLVELETAGATAQAMAAAANGRIAVLMTEGILGRAALNLRFSQVLIGLVRGGDDNLEVECGMVDLPITNGVGRFNVFVIDTEEMLVRGKGTVDFGRDRFDVLMQPRPKRGRTLAHNANVRITGSLREPRFKLDATDTVTTVAGTIGRFALLGPGGLFVNRNTFQRMHQECAGTLAEMTQEP